MLVALRGPAREFFCSRHGRRRWSRPTCSSPATPIRLPAAEDDGGYAEAIRLGIDVDITVSGPTLRARVTQIFRNPTKDWVEATYVYPLPTAAPSTR